MSLGVNDTLIMVWGEREITMWSGAYGTRLIYRERERELYADRDP